MDQPQPGEAADAPSHLPSREVKAGGKDRARRGPGVAPASPRLHATGGAGLGLSLVLLPSHPRAPNVARLAIYPGRPF